MVAIARLPQKLKSKFFEIFSSLCSPVHDNSAVQKNKINFDSMRQTVHMTSHLAQIALFSQIFRALHDVQIEGDHHRGKLN